MRPVDLILSEKKESINYHDILFCNAKDFIYPEGGFCHEKDDFSHYFDIFDRFGGI